MLDGASSHNCVYREIDITDMYNNGEFSTNVANGSFKNIFPGCYIKKTKTIDGTTYTDSIDIIVSLDPYYGKWNGSSYITTHHVGIVPFTLLGTSYMNSTNITTGGFKSTYMHNTTLPKYLTGYKNAYGASHFLTFGELISNNANENVPAPATDGLGRTNSWEWVITQITLLSEVQVYGCMVFSSAYDVGEACKQLEAFQYNHELQTFRTGHSWLRGVVNVNSFTASGYDGKPDAVMAGFSLYVRPLLLLY